MTVGIKYDKIPDIENAIYLYDNHPAFEPDDNMMVCFASPNSNRLSAMSKKSQTYFHANLDS